MSMPISDAIRSDTQRVDDVAYAIACVMVRRNLIDMLGDILVDIRKRELRVDQLAREMALDLRGEAMAAIQAAEATS